MITCESIYEIRIKTPSGIKSIPPGTIFESDNDTGVLLLLKQRKIRVLSRSKIHFPLQQSLQSPQSLQSENCIGFPDTDIKKQKSAMSAINITGESRPRSLLPKNNTVTGWNQEMRGLIDWFHTTPRRTQPFHLAPHLYVFTPEKFYESLQLDIQEGPLGPRGRHGALMDDLKKLRKVIDAWNFQ
jgi:hypothetical protein